MTLPLVIIVILNTNRGDDTLACLESLKNNDYTHHKVLVLDNASTDGSVEAIQTQFPEVEIVSLTKNLGYAGNNNIGINLALEQQADWVFVLNEDTILDPACLSQLVTVGNSNPKIGIVGPMVYHHNEPQIIQSAGGEINQYLDAFHIAQNQPDTGQFINPRPVDWISGCAILVRREVIKQVGALDEQFFIYYEETEWCLRAAKQNWQIMHVPFAKLWHKGVQRDYNPNPSVTYYFTRNKFLMLSKHKAPFKAWLHTWLQVIRTLTSWTLKPKWRAKRQHRNAMVKAIVDYSRGRFGKADL